MIGRTRTRLMLGCAWVAVAGACSGPGETYFTNGEFGELSAALRDMDPSEAEQDLEQIFGHVHSLYGPYEYKQERFGFSIADLEQQARAMLAESPGDNGFFETARWFLTRFQDGHVSLTQPRRSDPAIGYQIGIAVQPVEGKALVGGLLDSSLAGFGIGYGDEVLAVDGVAPYDFLPEAVKLDSLGNDLSNEHLILRAFLRPGFASGLVPQSPVAVVDFRRADGSEYSRELVWREVTENQAGLVTPSGDARIAPRNGYYVHAADRLGLTTKGSLFTIGATRPFFLTPPTAAAFDITEVTANETMLSRYGLDPSSTFDIFGALYSFEGKNILLVRQSGYGNEDFEERLQYYKALLDQYDAFVDGLIVDQTHNPGGFIDYCTGFARLFAHEPGGGFVQAMNTDRRWINGFRDYARFLDPNLASELSRRYELRASIIEEAYDAEEGVAPPLPFDPAPELLPDDEYVWNKPVLILIDELAGSCGDMFPLLVKNNGLAPLFGRRTMGLGGNVEQFGPLTNSDAMLSLTRGLATTYRADGQYATEDFVENRGVVPDIEHEIAVDDFRGGFVQYMTHFSQVLSSLIEGPPPAAQEPASDESEAPPTSEEPASSEE